jgi:hypothetical protein
MATTLVLLGDRRFSKTDVLAHPGDAEPSTLVQSRLGARR